MRRFSLCSLLLLLALWPAQGWGGVLATDDFNRADAGLGANWTTITTSSDPQIRSNVVEDLAVAGASANALYTGISWPDDQYASLTILTLNTGNLREASVWLRTITAAVTGYVCTANGPLGASVQLRIRRFNAGAATAGADSGATETVASTNVMKCTVVNSGADAIVKLYIMEVDE
jgi:hypothetical protein